MLFNLNERLIKKKLKENKKNLTPQNKELKRDIATGEEGITVIEYYNNLVLRHRKT